MHFMRHFKLKGTFFRPPFIQVKFFLFNSSTSMAEITIRSVTLFQKLVYQIEVFVYWMKKVIYASRI